MGSGKPEDVSPSPLAISEWLAIAFSAALLVSLFALPWFGFSLDGEVVPGSTGDAFRWLHGLDVVLLVVALVTVGTALMRIAGPARPGPLLIGIVAATVASFLIGALMISPPEGGEATHGALGGNPPGELVPQRGSLVGLAAALGTIVTGWIGIGRLMETVTEAQAIHAPEPTAPAPVQTLASTPVKAIAPEPAASMSTASVAAPRPKRRSPTKPKPKAKASKTRSSSKSTAVKPTMPAERAKAPAKPKSPRKSKAEAKPKPKTPKRRPQSKS